MQNVMCCCAGYGDVLISLLSDSGYDVHLKVVLIRPKF
jgi:hypothetical protein